MHAVAGEVVVDVHVELILVALEGLLLPPVTTIDTAHCERPRPVWAK